MAILAHHPTIDAAFLSAATSYWTSVFPFACREIHTWERHAHTIPDPNLRAVAVRALRDERGNLEGATAFAAFVPRARRMVVARAAIAFQAAYDYADAISEQSRHGSPGNTWMLHQALVIALKPNSTHRDYYARNIGRDDGGYLKALVDRCRFALTLLPAFSLTVRCLRRAAVRIATYQELNHTSADSASDAFERWAKRETPPGAEIRWWETAAAAGSSLAVFALMAAAAYPTLRPYQVLQLESSYFPWIGSLHTLLDSLIDRDEDEASGQKSLIDYYASREEAITRLQVLADRAGRQARSLSDGNHHLMILAAMASFYLSVGQATDPWSQLVRQRILGSLGDYAALALFVLRAKDVVERLARRAAPS